MRKWGFIFCLRFRRHFFKHTDFLRFKISKKIFFLNFDFGYQRKMYRLVPCIPILGSFLIKNEKRMCIGDYVIFVLVLVKMCFFSLKKGISRLLHWIDPKHTTGLFKSQIFFRMHRIPNGLKNLFYQNGKLIFPYSFSLKNTWNISSIKFKMLSALFYVNSLNF